MSQGKTSERQSMQNPVDMHVGHYLSLELEAHGHDVRWLAERTGMETEQLRLLLASANMEAALFVRLGETIDPHFLQGLEQRMLAGHANG